MKFKLKKVHRLVSSVKDKYGNRHNVITTRMKFESYKLFYKRHDLKVQLKEYKLRCLSK
jgi:hypothetical protein|nr:MAG TPA: hypothetical protein [Caudoviricetes sp.]